MARLDDVLNYNSKYIDENNVLKNKIIAEKTIKVITEKDGDYVVKNDFGTGEMLITQEIEPRLLGQKADVESAQTEEK